jgi:hypothetical protein
MVCVQNIQNVVSDMFIRNGDKFYYLSREELNKNEPDIQVIIKNLVNFTCYQILLSTIITEFYFYTFFIGICRLSRRRRNCFQRME